MKLTLTYPPMLILDNVNIDGFLEYYAGTVKISICMTSEVITSFTNGLHLFPNLRELKIVSLPSDKLQLTEDFLKTLFYNCPYLAYLELHNCIFNEVSDQPFPVTNLKSLSIYHNQPIYSKLIKSSPLQELFLKGQETITYANELAESIKQCSSLKFIYLNESYNNDEIYSALKTIRKLEIRFTMAINVIPLLTNLEDITISLYNTQYDIHHAPQVERLLILLSTTTTLKRLKIDCYPLYMTKMECHLTTLANNNPNLASIDIATESYSRITKKNALGPWSESTHHNFPLSVRRMIREILRNTIDIMNDDILCVLIAKIWEQIRVDPKIQY